MRDIIIESFASEWHFMLRYYELLNPLVDRVSIITSGLLDQTKHAVTKRASPRFRIAFFASLLVIIIAPVAPGAITVARDVRTRPNNLLVGALPAGKTNGTVRDPIVAYGDKWSDADQLAFSLSTRAARLAYVANVDHASLTYVSDLRHFSYTTHRENFDRACRLVFCLVCLFMTIRPTTCNTLPTLFVTT